MTIKTISASISKFSILLLFLAHAAVAGAQSKKAVKLISQGMYAEAAKSLQRDFESGGETAYDAGIMLAQCYYQLKEYPEALDVLQTLGEDNFRTSKDERLFADVLIATDDFSSAYLSMLKLLSKDPTDEKTATWLNKIENILDWDTATVRSSVEVLQGFNTIYNEYSPYISPDNQIWYINDINNVQSVFPASYNNQGIHLYFKVKKPNPESVVLAKPSMLIKKKDYYYHDGPLDFSKKLDKYALTLRDIDAPASSPIFGIYFSDMSGKKTSIDPFEHNGKFGVGHPAFSKDGERMIFSSDRPGGYGQMDLWYSDWVGGKWSIPVNMGRS